VRPDLDRLVREGGLVYIVVDDLAAGVAELVVCEWPRVDSSGRLVFNQDAARSLAAFEDDMRALLEERVPIVAASPSVQEALRRRPLQVGDVFGAVLREELAEDVETPDHLGRWLRAPVIDLTAEAREAAKVQYYATVSHVLSVAELDAIVEEFTEGEGPPDTTPEDRGGGSGPPVPPLEPAPAGGLEVAESEVAEAHADAQMRGATEQTQTLEAGA
jgi:hypothetical protein